MKILILALSLLTALVMAGASNLIDFWEKAISVAEHGSWEYREHKYPSLSLPLKIQTDLKQVRIVGVADLNAKDELCRTDAPWRIGEVNYSPSVNMESLTLYIRTPCLVNGKARLKVSIKTNEKAGNKNYSFTKALDYALLFEPTAFKAHQFRGVRRCWGTRWTRARKEPVVIYRHF